MNRFSVYWSDIRNKGFLYFIDSRLKKHKFSRRFISLTYKPYVIVSGCKLYIDRMDNVVSETLLTTGEWEPFTTSIITGLAKKSKFIIDIGAHVGYYTVIASRHIKKGGEVLSFEPSSRSYSFLRHTITENRLTNVTAVNGAVDIVTGLGKLYLSPNNIGDHRIFPTSEKRKYKTIRKFSLDDYLSSDTRIIDLIKIDIQGNEVNALNGMRKLLNKKRIRYIMTELWPKGLLLNNSSWQSYINLLRKSGFELWEIDDDEKQIIPINLNKIKLLTKQDEEYLTNLLCILKN